MFFVSKVYILEEIYLCFWLESGFRKIRVFWVIYEYLLIEVGNGDKNNVDGLKVKNLFYN